MKTTWRLGFGWVSGWWVVVCCLPLVPWRLVAQTIDTDATVIVLPTYEVEDRLPLPDAETWRYARLSGFEILSNASDGTTQKLIREFQDFAFALNLVWPVEVEWPVPVKIVICGRPRSFGDLVPKKDGRAPTWMVSREENAVIVVDASTRELALPAHDRLYWRNDDFEQLGPDGLANRIRVGSSVDLDQHLAREFVRYIFSRANGPVPPWLEEGVAQLAMKMEVGRRRIEFGLLELPKAEPNAQDITQMMEARQFEDMASASGFSPRIFFNGASAPADLALVQPSNVSQRGVSLFPSKFMPFDEMFSTGYDSPGARGGPVGLWARQCELFVHFCLYGWHKKKFQPALLALVDRAVQGPVSEEVFKESFGFGFKELGARLRRHATFPDQRPYRGDLLYGMRLPEASSIDLRNATDAEVARVKAAALDLAGRSDTARMELINAFRRGERDPELLASLGLLEVREDRVERGRTFLEAAVREHATKNPRAYVALARLWLEEAGRSPNGANGLLDRRQVAGVLRWLFVARDLQPRLPGVYETIAETWKLSEAPPTRANLEVLSEGVRLFPRNAGLVVSAAELNLRHGFFDMAAALAEHGLKLRLDEQARGRLEDVRARAGAPSTGQAGPSCVPATAVALVPASG